MEARFFCRTGALAGADHRIAGSATIGRGSSNAIVVGDGVVSKAHARIAFDPAAAAWVLEDLGSTNGTRLDGVPVSGRERLRDLHVVTLGGRHDFIFVVLPAGAGAVEGASADSPRLEAGTRHDRPAALSVPPLAAGPPPAAGDSAGDSVPSGSPAAGAGTSHDRPAALSVPPLVAGAAGAGDAGDAPAGAAGVSKEPRSRSGDSPATGAGTRHDRPAALSVPPLAGGGDLAPPDGGPPPAAGGGPAPPDAGPPPSARGGADSAKGAAGEPSAAGVPFEVRAPDRAPRRVALGDGRHVFGRAKDCAVSIDDRTLSRRHAAFTVAGGRVSVEDLGSLNGTFVGGVRIEEATGVGGGGVVGLGEQVKVLVGAGP